MIVNRIPLIPVNAAALFWCKVDKNGPVPNHCQWIGCCWEWLGTVDKRGYGRVYMNERGLFAHRVAYAIHYGGCPRLLVCHHCDNPKCVRPSHLFLGTHKDNAQDCSAKGRHHEAKTTHCPQGHKYTLENTWLGNNGAGRQCLKCKRQRTFEKYYHDKGLPVPKQPRKWIARKVL